jgi:hypothetical protein
MRMKQMLLIAVLTIFLFACKNNKQQASGVQKSSVTLPYTATYSSSFTNEVSDVDLQTVLQTYKDWAEGNVTNLASAFADTIDFDSWDGESMRLSRYELSRKWVKYRDSLRSVDLTIEAWHKMYSTDKKDAFVVVWYKEIDTHKNGTADSARWHDINMIKNGKIVWYSQYRRPLK